MYFFLNATKFLKAYCCVYDFHTCGRSKFLSLPTKILLSDGWLGSLGDQNCESSESFTACWSSYLLKAVTCCWGWNLCSSAICQNISKFFIEMVLCHRIFIIWVENCMWLDACSWERAYTFKYLKTYKKN